MNYRHQLLEKLKVNAEKKQDKVAVFNKTGNITYGELNTIVMGLSNKIIEKFGSGNDLIALRVNDNLEALLTILGLTFANKTVLPIPYEIPDDKFNQIISDLNPAGIITDSVLEYKKSITLESLKKSDDLQKEYSIQFNDESNFIVIMTSGT